MNHLSRKYLNFVLYRKEVVLRDERVRQPLQAVWSLGKV